jgi:hypothetical protein
MQGRLDHQEGLSKIDGSLIRPRDGDGQSKQQQVRLALPALEAKCCVLRMSHANYTPSITSSQAAARQCSTVQITSACKITCKIRLLDDDKRIR